MFSVGRYDPNIEDKKGKEKAAKFVERFESDSSKKRKIVEVEIEVSDGNRKDIQKNEVDESSSCPSSSDEETSSYPPSPEENDADSDEESAAFDVIAPEQKEDSLDKMRKRIKSTSEGIDDFDHDVQNERGEQSAEVARAIKLSKIPIKDAAKIWKLAPFLVENLEKDDYNSFFPIQALVIPDVISSERHAHIRNRDICVASPTGSGKTLAFVLPVLNSLSGRQVRRLRALVVLPSRDLGKYRC